MLGAIYMATDYALTGNAERRIIFALLYLTSFRLLYYGR